MKKSRERERITRGWGAGLGYGLDLQVVREDENYHEDEKMETIM